MELNVRQAKISDTKTVCRLFAEGAELHAQHLPMLLSRLEPSAAEEFVRNILQAGNTRVLLAELNEQAVGLVHFNLVNDRGNPAKMARSFVSVSTLIVQVTLRRRGIGTTLMQRVHQWADEQQIKDVELNVNESNAQARSFYEQLGYETISRRMKKGTR